MKWFFVYLLLILIFFSVTNPSTADCKQYVYEHIKANDSSLLDRVVAKTLLEEIDLFTVRTDMIIFSVYEVKILDKQYLFLGLLKHFAPVHINIK